MSIGSDRQFFFDDEVVEDRWDLRRVSLQAAKHPANPVIVPDQIYENHCYDCSVIYDENRQLFQMWYQDFSREAYYQVAPKEDVADGRSYFVRYAESRDGVNWQKPALGLWAGVATALVSFSSSNLWLRHGMFV